MENKDILTKLFFRLLPVQILIFAMGAVNSIVDGAVAGRCIDAGTVGVVGLYYAMIKILEATGSVLLGGCSVLCGRSMGSGDMKKTDAVFSLDIALTVIFGAAYTLISVLTPGVLADILGANEELKGPLILYILGFSIGIIPMLLAQQLAFFLQLERQSARGYAGIAGMIISNVALDILLVAVLDMGVLGLALATSISNLVYLLILIPYYLFRRSQIRFSFGSIDWPMTWDIIRIGFPGAVLVICLALRGITLNRLLLKYTGSAGLSAQSAFSMVSGIFIAFALGIGAVLRTLCSVFFGEEDRESLKRVAKIAVVKTLPLSLLITVMIIVLSSPMAMIFFPDRAAEVYVYTHQLFIIYALCIPLIVMCQVFANYLQAAGHNVYLNVLSVFDGYFSMVIPAALMMPFLGAMGAWLSNPVGIVLTLLLTAGYVCLFWKRLPGNLDEFMLLKPDFGVPAEDRLDLMIRDMDQVSITAETVQRFCAKHGFTGKTAFYAALCLEEMAGNVVTHGFSADKKDHIAEVKVIIKGEDITLRLKDDCIPFDPKERAELVSEDDPARNIGLRMVTRFSKEMTYQNMMGLNVLTIGLKDTDYGR